MVDYFKEYNDAQTHISLNKQKVIQNHISNYQILEEALGFQYYLNGKFFEYYKSNLDTKELLNEHFAELSIHLLFFYNVMSLQTAFNTLECGFIHQSAVNLRTVYEGIPKMYYISFFPEKVREITVHEYIHPFRYEDAIEKLKDKKYPEDLNEETLSFDEKTEYQEWKKYQDLLNGETLPFNVKKEYQEWKKMYTPAWFRNQLYTEERVKKLHKLYGRLSASTHANISRNETAVEYTFADTDLFFQLMKSLSYFNLEAYLEGNYQLLCKMNLQPDVLTFLNRMANNLETIIEDVYFLPNKEKYKSKLKTTPVSR